eukprot:g9428.t1
MTETNATESSVASIASAPGDASERKDADLRSDAYWAVRLTPDEFEILRNRGTEPAGTGEYVSHFSATGYYACRACGLPLYPAVAKFRSQCGWPAYRECYFSARDADGPHDGSRLTSHVAYVKDDSHGRTRLEIRCNRCEGHLGHIFLGHKSEAAAEGGGEGKERHCVNSRSVRYVKEDVALAPGSWTLLQVGNLRQEVPQELCAELDDVKFAADDSRNVPLSAGTSSGRNCCSTTCTSSSLVVSTHPADFYAAVLKFAFPVEWGAASGSGGLDVDRMRAYMKVLGFREEAFEQDQLTSQNLFRYLAMRDGSGFESFSYGASDGLSDVGPSPASLRYRFTAAETRAATSAGECGIEARRSLLPNAGEGLFASRDFRRGEYVCVYFGKKVGFASKMKRATELQEAAGNGAARGIGHSGSEEDDDGDLDYVLGGFGIFSVDARFSPSPARYVNDGGAEKCNLRFVKSKRQLHAILVCTKGVKSGDEFYVDYGKGYWRAREAKENSK